VVNNIPYAFFLVKTCQSLSDLKRNPKLNTISQINNAIPAFQNIAKNFIAKNLDKYIS